MGSLEDGGGDELDAGLLGWAKLVAPSRESDCWVGRVVEAGEIMAERRAAWQRPGRALGLE